MGTYDPAEPLALLIKKLERGREFACAGGKTIADAMMVLKGITLLAHMAMFNEDIREWRWQTMDLKPWDNYNALLQQAQRKQNRAVKTTGKGGYTAAVQNIYSVPPPPPEENHEAIEKINTIDQGMQMQSYDLEGLAQANAVLTSSNSVVMAQLAQMNVTMKTM